ncbi:MAG: 2-amino-4-ketopentanoate thiolase, partial [Burkholderiales bacterium]|nr:2-amino-4-ketopentanoate thiolase [Burkholderiales bacterium]
MPRKDDWGLVHRVVLRPEERTANIPEETKKVPFEMWVKGRLKSDADLGQEVTI